MQFISLKYETNNTQNVSQFFLKFSLLSNAALLQYYIISPSLHGFCVCEDMWGQKEEFL